MKMIDKNYNYMPPENVILSVHIHTLFGKLFRCCGLLSTSQKAHMTNLTKTSLQKAVS